MKFVMSKIKKLIVDEYGNMRFIDSFDNVVEDIFGVKNFAHKINDCYDDRDTITVLNMIGLKNLIDICNNPKIYGIFAEMIEMDHRIMVIKKAQKKASRKGKHIDKDLIKELKYLSEIYKDAIKIMRKKFGVKSQKSSYKRRFAGVSSLVDSRNNFGYDDNIRSILYDGDSLFDDDDDDDDDFYTDDDDDDTTSELEFYLKKLNKSKGKSNRDFQQSATKQPRFSQSRRADSDFDEEDDDDDELGGGTKDLASKVDQLATIVSGMANTMQMQMNAKNVRPVMPTVQLEPVIERTAGLDVSETLSNLTKAVSIMASKQNELINVQDQLVAFIAGTEVEDDDDDSPLNALSQEINRYDDPTETASYDGSVYQKTNVQGLDREGLVDLINNSEEASIKVQP